MSHRVAAPDSGKSRFVQLLSPYTMWGYLYPDTDATGTVRGLANPTPRQANACGDSSGEVVGLKPTASQGLLKQEESNSAEQKSVLFSAV
ncbi:hypothetical protein [Thermostichus sp. OS-CIW-31]